MSPRRKPTESALLVAVPEAETVVGGWRSLYDPSEAVGVPAHVTLLYPFVPPAQIDESVLETVRETLQPFRAFGHRYERVGQFPTVLYLAPEPDERFRAIMRALWDAFPDHPPYGGQFEDVVPHLTVIDLRGRRDLALMKRARASLDGSLPFASQTSDVWLMTGHPNGGWRCETVFPLRP